MLIIIDTKMHLTTNDLPSVEAREHDPNVLDNTDSARE